MACSYDPVVQDLKDFIYRYDDRRDDFFKAIISAKDINNDGAEEMCLENIDTLEDYFRFCNDMLRWVPRVDTPGDALFRKLLVFYWIFNQPDVGKYQTSIIPENAGVDPKWLSYWQVLYVRTLGCFLDTRESACGIESFYSNCIYNKDAALWQDRPQGGWASFNQFFARRWKDIDVARPLSQADLLDDVIVSIADSRFGETFPVEDGNVVIIKGIEWPIAKLLQSVADDFKDGYFMHAFLSPADYHRQHAPVSGVVLEAKVIPELVYLQVTKDQKAGLVADRGLVVKKPLMSERRLKDLIASGGKKLRSLIAGVEKDVRAVVAPDEPGYQWCQTRGLIMIQTEKYGKIAVLPIGMAQVSSVVLTVEKGQKIEKGEEISYFQFGGSDVVLVFEKPVDFSVKQGDRCNVRTRIATFRGVPASEIKN
ncbi:putative phosphatidylserine decarboxylase [Annulohypoxylon maeteangense]|uniref:putative phosphatidylserine decarboxylase n=1 Tax=Annulohypoxylon maeteangense TaxID=1927788 RepID=UPI0020082B31|nr:putative phosphatidylserine decarboxylase [Annulohypoxylon maeteangense]KAI0882832.1 putative phosphatidylserine decarboxylase [Annulohypoxylon maeteangense]